MQLLKGQHGPSKIGGEFSTPFDYVPIIRMEVGPPTFDLVLDSVLKF